MVNFVALFENLFVKDIIFQPTENLLGPDNMFVINIGNNELNYSIHVFCFLRISGEGKILLTSSDEFVDSNRNFMNNNDYKHSIVFNNIKKTLDMIRDCKIMHAKINECGDLILHFSNNYYLEIIIDCCVKNYECYRILDVNNEKTLFVKKTS